ncbi:MAG TPA: hypothetical protein VFE62_06805 [Gemmataceae bacterium]|nr:hypothetical protein [Gemmataceae bacterium]
MHEHGPDELAGPVRGSAAWWQALGTPPEAATDNAPTTETAPRKRKQPSAAPIRKDLVDRVRKEIAAGTYDTREKWEAALDRLLERLNAGD